MRNKLFLELRIERQKIHVLNRVVPKSAYAERGIQLLWTPLTHNVTIRQLRHTTLSLILKFVDQQQHTRQAHYNLYDECRSSHVEPAGMTNWTIETTSIRASVAIIPTSRMRRLCTCRRVTRMPKWGQIHDNMLNNFSLITRANDRINSSNPCQHQHKHTSPSPYRLLASSNKRCAQWRIQIACVYIRSFLVLRSLTWHNTQSRYRTEYQIVQTHRNAYLHYHSGDLLVISF